MGRIQSDIGLVTGINIKDTVDQLIALQGKPRDAATAKQADLKSRGLMLVDPPATLQTREIELLADFMLARMVGKGPMDPAKCVEYLGADVEVCHDLPK